VAERDEDREVGKGSFFGEMALLEGNDRTATVIAETDVRLLVLSRTEFRSSHPRRSPDRQPLVRKPVSPSRRQALRELSRLDF